MNKEYHFLVDVNLPKYFTFFNNDNFTFVSDLNLSMSDLDIWDMALENNMVILTKDTDFYNKCILVATAPKIVHFRFGNYSIKQLYGYFHTNWESIVQQLHQAKMIVAFDTHLEIIYLAN